MIIEVPYHLNFQWPSIIENRPWILRRRQTLSFRTGSKAPLSINPEQTPGFRPGKVEGLIFPEEVQVRWRIKSGKGISVRNVAQSLL